MASLNLDREKVVADVCAGIAHKLDLNVTGLRWVVALATLFLFGISALVYLVLGAALTIFEGYYDIGVMTYCSMHCCGGNK